MYGFEAGSPFCEYLDIQESPEEQVRRASLYEFFRTVKFAEQKEYDPELGKYVKKFVWRAPKEMPVVMTAYCWW